MSTMQVVAWVAKSDLHRLGFSTILAWPNKTPQGDDIGLVRKDEAEAAIKAARVQALEPMSDEEAVSLGRTASTNNTYSEGRFLTALFTRDALVGFVRAIEAHHAIRLLGEDAGRGE